MSHSQLLGEKTTLKKNIDAYLALYEDVKIASDFLQHEKCMEPVENSLYDLVQFETYYCCKSFWDFFDDAKKLNSCIDFLAPLERRDDDRRHKVSFAAVERRAAVNVIFAAIDVSKEKAAELCELMDVLNDIYKRSGSRCMQTQFDVFTLDQDAKVNALSIGKRITQLIENLPATLSIHAYVCKAKDDVAERQAMKKRDCLKRKN